MTNHDAYNEANLVDEMITKVIVGALSEDPRMPRTLFNALLYLRTIQTSIDICNAEVKGKLEEMKLSNIVLQKDEAECKRERFSIILSHS